MPVSQRYSKVPLTVADAAGTSIDEDLADDRTRTPVAAAYAIRSTTEDVEGGHVATVTSAEDAVAYEYDWPGLQRGDRRNNLIGVSFALVAFALILFPFADQIDEIAVLVLFLLAVIMFCVRVIHVYHNANVDDLSSCPQTLVIPNQGVQHTWPDHEDQPGCTILIPFTEIKRIFCCAFGNSYHSTVVIQTNSTDGAEFVLSGIPRFGAKTQTDENNVAIPVRDQKVPLILRGLREPYLFKQNVAEEVKRQQPQSRVSELSSRINDALVDVQDTAARTVLCEIRDEIMRLNESLSK